MPASSSTDGEIMEVMSSSATCGRKKTIATLQQGGGWDGGRADGTEVGQMVQLHL